MHLLQRSLVDPTFDHGENGRKDEWCIDDEESMCKLRIMSLVDLCQSLENIDGFEVGMLEAKTCKIKDDGMFGDGSVVLCRQFFHDAFGHEFQVADMEIKQTFLVASSEFRRFATALTLDCDVR